MSEEDNGLSGTQEVALELMMRGMSDGEIAERTGKVRQTINHWRNHDPDFRPELAEQRKVIRKRHQDELSGLVSEAIGVMREAMREGNMPTRLRAAQAVLRMSGLQTAMQTEREPSSEESYIELIGKAIGEVAEEMGIYEPKRLPRGNAPAFHAP